jgi:hypothetical protein
MISLWRLACELPSLERLACELPSLERLSSSDAIEVRDHSFNYGYGKKIQDSYLKKCIHGSTEQWFFIFILSLSMTPVSEMTSPSNGSPSLEFIDPISYVWVQSSSSFEQSIFCNHCWLWTQRPLSETPCWLQKFLSIRSCLPPANNWLCPRAEVIQRQPWLAKYGHVHTKQQLSSILRQKALHVPKPKANNPNSLQLLLREQRKDCPKTHTPSVFPNLHKKQNVHFQTYLFNFVQDKNSQKNHFT